MSPEGGAKLEWIDLSDFRAGIVHNLGAYVQGTPAGYGPGAVGVASIDETVGCIALPAGGIGPLPSMDWQYIRPNPVAAMGSWDVAFSVYGPVVANPTGLPGRGSIGGRPIEFLFHWLGYDGAATSYDIVSQDKVWKLSPTVAEITAANIATPRSVTTLSPQETNGVTYFARTALNPTTPANPGNPTTIMAWAPDAIIGVSPEWMLAFPDPTAPTSGTPRDIATAARMNLSAFGPVLAHQARILALQNRLVGRGTATDSAALNDLLHYSLPNSDVRENTQAAIFGPEESTGYGTWASLNASDLLMIKNYGGALLIQGDINYPIVRRLPSVQSTGGIECEGALGPAGFAYLVADDGVYVFTGDGSQLLSPQLPPEFYAATGVLGGRGTLAWWGSWLLVPNGFLYSSDTQSWWRLDRTRDIYGWQIDPWSNYAYGIKSRAVRNAGTDKLDDFLYGFNRAVGAHTYTWKSQPMFVASPGRYVRAREIVLVAQGVAGSTVVATFTNADGSTTALTFTLAGSSTEPQTMRKTFVSRGATNFKLKLVATGNAAADPAPIIYAALIGWEPAEHVGPG